MLVPVREQLAAGDERLQDSEIDLVGGPLALGEEGGILVLLAHDVDLGLALMDGIVAPPTAKGGELHRGFAAEQQLPEVLLADLLEHLAHILGQMRLNARRPGPLRHARSWRRSPAQSDTRNGTYCRRWNRSTSWTPSLRRASLFARCPARRGS